MVNQNIYKEMSKILSDKKQGNAEIKHFTVCEYDFRAVIRDGLIPDNEYVKLIIDDEIMMSDAPMELASNELIINNAHGDMLIAGLGIGLILLPIAEKQNVNSVTVIEKNQNVIDIVSPQLPIDSKVKIINADIFDYTPERKFDCIYFDIWPEICRDHADEYNYLYDKYTDWLKDTSDVWIKCWQEDYVLGLSEYIMN